MLVKHVFSNPPPKKKNGACGQGLPGIVVYHCFRVLLQLLDVFFNLVNSFSKSQQRTMDVLDISTQITYNGIYHPKVLKVVEAVMLREIQ